MPPPGFLKSNNNSEEWASWWTWRGVEGRAPLKARQRRPRNYFYFFYYWQIKDKVKSTASGSNK